MAEKKKWNDKDATPLMRQYWKIKERNPNAILLYRMGDFYETFDEDARIASGVLGITLTKRANGKASEIDLAGFPYKALDQYLPKLVAAGHRVAICEQLEDPKLAKVVVKRDVTEVVTPGVAFSDRLLDPKRSHYLAAVHWGQDRATRGWVGFSFVDATTGEFATSEVPESQLQELLQTIAPAELLYDKRAKALLQTLPKWSFTATPMEDWAFGGDFANEVLLRHFKTHSLKGFGIENMPLGVIAAGVVLHYLSETQKGKLPHIRRLIRFSNEDYISLDPQTKRNLELVASMQDGGRDGSLIQILDHTQTPPGGRLLRKWLVRPLRNIENIRKRLDAVGELVENHALRQQIREELAQVGDLERIIAKISTARATPRELVYLKLTLRQIPPLKTLLRTAKTASLRSLGDHLLLCAEVVDRLDDALIEDAPASITEGGMFRTGFHAGLDELRMIASSGKDWLAEMRQKEIERTGIPSLKVSFNNVFGYYIEITNAHKDKVPADYIRKQTLVNAERYITPALKEYEEKILTAEEKISGLEQSLFNELRLAIAEETESIQKNAQLLAILDCFASLAEVASRYGYTRPEVHDGDELDIVEGRHPVVERTLPPGEPFIPNSVRLSRGEAQMLMITGPNMAGKSVILRQTALIVLLAQVGSFVPASHASVGVVDKIFTRVGASDNLAAGESTFLVEMNETANILNNASPKSLILLDEVGRGTSTFDGMSIAWAIAEYIHDNPAIAARTLFATHYHELNALADRCERIRNARVQVQEHNGRVIFLRKLVPGGADSSYGIEVARMAGLPMPVIDRAKEILESLEAQRLEVTALTERSFDTVEPLFVNRLSQIDNCINVSLPDSLPGAPHSVTKEALVPDSERPEPTAEPHKEPITAGPKLQHARMSQVPVSGFSQMSLFSDADPVASEIKELLIEIDLNRLTPIEAMMQLSFLQRKAKEG
ncbi:MAG: DNA mismatch repair protein MutS [Bacteroidetes Order II. Incertae sedis bacterium]|nr:DNA mismatch repair protein MutS [Bacteroidetes Order II. bacterium]